MDIKIRWCGCKSTCAEEDRGRSKPNPDGACEAGAEDGPIYLAEKIFGRLTLDQQEAIAGSGITDDVLEIVETEAQNWATEDIDRTTDAIEKLCGYVKEQR